MSHATSGGVTALPIRANECVTPCPNPRLRDGSQSDIARVAVGRAETPIPSITRLISIPPRLLVTPIHMVAADQMTANAVNAFRAPHRSLTQPPMNWNTRYGNANIEKISPTCLFES